MDVGLFQISNVSKFKKEHKYVIKLITSNESSYLDLDAIEFHDKQKMYFL